jgi:hypothetical protein
MKSIPIAFYYGKEASYEWLQRLAVGKNIIAKEFVSHIPEISKTLAWDKRDRRQFWINEDMSTVKIIEDTANKPLASEIVKAALSYKLRSPFSPCSLNAFHSSDSTIAT